MYEKSVRLFRLVLLCWGVCLLCNACKPELPSSLPGMDTPEWRGLTLGESTEEEVLQALGTPSEVRDAPVRNVSIWSYQSDHGWQEVGISSKGQLVYVWFDSECEEEEYYCDLRDYLKAYGEPERVTWGVYSKYKRTFIWSSEGVALEGQIPAWVGEREAMVHYVELFEPMEMEVYLETWGQDIQPWEDPYGQEDAYHNPEVECPFP